MLRKLWISEIGPSNNAKRQAARLTGVVYFPGLVAVWFLVITIEPERRHHSGAILIRPSPNVTERNGHESE